jgi:hypothetical protein
MTETGHPNASSEPPAAAGSQAHVPAPPDEMPDSPREPSMPEREAPPPVSEIPKVEPDESQDLLTRLADVGEDAIRRFGRTTGITGAMALATSTLERLDDVTARVRAMSKLEARVRELEAQVAELKKEAPPPRPPAASAGAGDAQA